MSFLSFMSHRIGALLLAILAFGFFLQTGSRRISDCGMFGSLMGMCNSNMAFLWLFLAIVTAVASVYFFKTKH